MNEIKKKRKIKKICKEIRRRKKKKKKEEKFTGYCPIKFPAVKPPWEPPKTIIFLGSKWNLSIAFCAAKWTSEISWVPIFPGKLKSVSSPNPTDPR